MDLEAYKDSLIKSELSENTIEKYIKDIEQLHNYLKDNGKNLSKESLIEYKAYLLEKYKTSTVKSKITTINKYLGYLNKGDLKLRQIKEQNPNSLDDIMTQIDYERMERVGKNKGLDFEVMTIQAIYYSGVRVSELQFFTVEAVNLGYMTIDNKGKIRKVPITNKLKSLSRKYIKDHNIKSGPILVNNKGKAVSRYTIYRRMKYLAGQARVKKTRVTPHNLRHLFAKNYLKQNNSVLHLADILGHESLETTRIYTRLSTDEARETMEKA